MGRKVMRMDMTQRTTFVRLWSVNLHHDHLWRRLAVDPSRMRAGGVSFTQRCFDGQMDDWLRSRFGPPFEGSVASMRRRASEPEILWMLTREDSKGTSSGKIWFTNPAHALLFKTTWNL
jgi:hypothetical protein